MCVCVFHHDNVFTVLDMLLECAAPETERESVCVCVSS